MVLVDLLRNPTLLDQMAMLKKQQSQDFASSKSRGKAALPLYVKELPSFTVLLSFVTEVLCCLKRIHETDLKISYLPIQLT